LRLSRRGPAVTVAQLTVGEVSLRCLAPGLFRDGLHETEDAERATHRMRVMMRESLAVFSGRTPAFGVPTIRPRRDD
jgi:hypothetical protein